MAVGLMGSAAVRRTIKRSLLIATTIVVLALVAVELISWNFLKPRIVAQVEAATGRDFAIAGSVEVDLLPRPAITLHEVSLANPAWTGPGHFVEIERLRVAPDLLSLATGRLALARVDVDEPTIRLIDRRDGPPNWVFATGGGADESRGGPIPIHRLHVAGARIDYRPAGQGDPVRVQIASARLTDDGETADADVTLSVGGRNVKLRARADSLFAWRAANERFEGELELATSRSRIESRFSLSPSSFPAQWQLRVDGALEAPSDWLELVSGGDPAAVGPVEFDAKLTRDGSAWRAEGVSVGALQSRLEASLALDTADDIPRLDGSIRIAPIDVAALGEALPGSEAEPESLEWTPPPPVLPSLSGTVDIDLERISGLAVPITHASGQLRFAKHRVSVENIEIAAAESVLRGAAQLTSSPDAVSGAVVLSAPAIEVDRGQGSLPRVAADLDIRLAEVPRQRWGSDAVIGSLAVDTATFEYARPARDTRLSASASLVGEDVRPVVAISGTLKGRAVQAEIEGAALAPGWPGAGYGLAGNAESGNLAMTFDTTLESIMNPARFQGRLSLSGDGLGALEPWLGRELTATPPFELAGRLKRDGARWHADEVSLSIGESILRGSGRVDIGGRPRVEVTLQAEPLDLAWLQAQGEGQDPAEQRGGSPFDPAWLRGFDAGLDFGAARVLLPSGKALSGLEVQAALVHGVLDLEQFIARIGDGSISFTGRLAADASPASARIDARFDDVALGRLADTFTPLEERLGRLSGHLDAVVTETLPEAVRDDVLAPMIGRVKIEPSELSFVDPKAGTDLQLSARTDGLTVDDQHFTLQGSGTYDGEPASLEFRSDALLDIRLPDRAFSMDLDATLVGTRIELEGAVMRPLALKGLDLQLSFDGPNPQRLSRLIGVPLPDLPAYDVSGRLGLSQGRWSLSDLRGRVGDSDLGGHLALDAGTSPPSLTGELHSDSLDIDDLAGVAGAEPPESAGKNGQRQESGRETRDRFVLPDDPLVGEAWRRVAADVRYRGASVKAGEVPLSDLVIDFRLAEGLASFEPVTFGVGKGDVDVSLELDASRQPAAGTLEVEVRSVDLREALKNVPLADDSVGIVGAEGKFWVTGESIAGMLGSADGGLIMLMTEGRLEALLVELAGLDAAQAFLTWLGGTQGFTINCAYADLQARDGLLHLDTFVVDTVDTIFTAGGRVDLAEERVDVSVVAHPQDASVLVARTPFHFGGTFADMETGIHGGELGLRVAGSAGLAALAGPLAAAIPLLETGEDDRTGYCEGLTERTRQAIENGEEEA